MFTDCKLVHYLPNGDVDPGTTTYPARHEIAGWSETPWRLASATLEADRLSVPELHEYLTLNSDFTSPQLAPFRTYLNVRWALPWMCLVVVLIAAPLGIVYQRRSVIVGVASSIILFLCFLFFDNLFHALGRGDRGVGPFWAAWATNLVFGLIGVGAAAGARAQPRPAAVQPGAVLGFPDRLVAPMQEWTIQARTDRCDITGERFNDGEAFYTLLFRDEKTDALHRRDVSQKSWRALQADPAAEPPFSFWRSKFTPPPPPAPEALPKADAEGLLRRFLTEDLPGQARAAYILALMLERKRVLRPTGSRRRKGRKALFYEHVRTGETFVVVDPGLRLDQIEEVQREVSGLLEGGRRKAES